MGQARSNAKHQRQVSQANFDCTASNSYDYRFAPCRDRDLFFLAGGCLQGRFPSLLPPTEKCVCITRADKMWRREYPSARMMLH